MDRSASLAMMLWTAPPERHQVPKRGRRSATKREAVHVEKFIRIAIDLGKNYFQVHGLESEGGRSISRKIKRSKVHEVCSQIEPCRVGMEACGSAHYWARELTAMGHEVVLIPPAYIKPYVKRGKNDAVDAAAICEAMSRPNMRFVPVKSAEQQAVLMLHKTRDLLVKQRTMAVNALRGHLAEFGVVAAKGIGRVDELLALAKADAVTSASRRDVRGNLHGPTSGRARPVDRGVERGDHQGSQTKSDRAVCLTRFPALAR